MRKTKEVLRLRYELGLGQRASIRRDREKLILLLEKQRPFPMSVANTKRWPLLQIAGPCPGWQPFGSLIGSLEYQPYRLSSVTRANSIESPQNSSAEAEQPNTEIWACDVP
jgi:hypothetical protein